MVSTLLFTVVTYAKEHYCFYEHLPSQNHPTMTTSYDKWNPIIRYPHLRHIQRGISLPVNLKMPLRSMGTVARVCLVPPKNTPQNPIQQTHYPSEAPIHHTAIQGKPLTGQTPLRGILTTKIPQKPEFFIRPGF